MGSMKDVAQWAQEHPADSRYGLSIATEDRVVFSCMIEIDPSERYLGPLFAGGHGLAVVKDDRNYPGLKVESVAYYAHMDRVARAATTIGRDVLKAADASTRREYLSGRYRNKTYEPVRIDDARDSFRFNVPNAMPGSATLDHPWLQRDTFADDHLGGVELVSLFASLVEKVPRDELLEIMLSWKGRIDAHSDRFVREMRGYTTVERPYRLLFLGADDFVYARAFATVEQARAVVEVIADDPSEAKVVELLDFAG